MKKLLFLILTLVVFSTAVSATVYVDGGETALDGYAIEDYNYYKLRDIATVLSGTANEFSVTWDKATQSIQLTTGEAYTPVGGELTTVDGDMTDCAPATASLYIDGQMVEVGAYELDGNNYYKLRDLGDALGFAVDWDGASVLLTTTSTAPTTPEEAIARLKSQNAAYVTATENDGDISPIIRQDTVENGQTPYAVVLTCSDSRVVPEHIFMAGIGELFTIRNAGNIVDNTVLGSVEYGAEHLHAQVVVVLGHTSCGAVDATLSGGGHDHIALITDKIALAIGDETQAEAAQILNVEHAVQALKDNEIVAHLMEAGELAVVGAIYHADTGEVVFLDEEPTDAALYQIAVEDAVVAQEDEIFPLVTLTPEDENTTWNAQGEVLLVAWNRYPDSYVAGSTMTLDYGPLWTFTLDEMAAWYGKHGQDIDHVQMRFNQLIGLPPEENYTHFTALWVDPDDVKRPAYSTDVTQSDMALELTEADEAYVAWFEENMENSYESEWPYPWTRLGYTYDWADNGTDYGLTEFLVDAGAEVTVEFTMTTDEFLGFIQ